MKLEGYYQGVTDIPLENWIECTNGNLNYCRIDLKKGNDINDLQAWENIFDSYIKKYGLNKMYLKMLEAMKAKALEEVEYVITGDRFKLTKIEVETQKLQSMVKNAGTGIDIRESLIYISKWMGQWINPKQITAEDFFNLQKQYERFNKSK